jgi:hypothetical protein
MAEASALAKEVLDSVDGYIVRSVAPLNERVDALEKGRAKKAAEIEGEFLRLLQIVDQRLNGHDKAAQKVSALESRLAALERKVKG